MRFQLVNAQSFQNQNLCLIPGSCSILTWQSQFYGRNIQRDG